MLFRSTLALGTTLDLLFELHTGEESKTGFQSLQDLIEAFEYALACPTLRPRGLMTMAPYTEDEAPIRRSFRSCARAFRELGDRFRPDAWDTLSMGMTNDYPLAIEEGSTMLRIGTAIFGERDYSR